jgi:hypothetical protein
VGQHTLGTGRRVVADERNRTHLRVHAQVDERGDVGSLRTVGEHRGEVVELGGTTGFELGRAMIELAFGR